MGITKSDLFTTEQNQIAAYTKVLGHPARIAIIEQIIQEGQCINKSLVKELGLSQASISQHLKELKSAGLIQGTIEGQSVHYCLNTRNWAILEEKMQKIFKAINNQNIHCKI
ncbi:metalloregulator ArsR/SmtB family transcription factor [Halosquirtibacter laminarini]|uniref:Metalloregulator ArsR/SmtB family transcription factor n=1 Tax=Halosquirtibacter laminarini TaxID=3374600 RepID=A0AC61NPL5_9BACT|nr:metalloregulator ArsR/SmtB family transcription factor [Prolixibacteraceae bacterium]